MLTAEQRLKLIAKAGYGDVRATGTVLRDLSELLGGTIPADLETAIENIVTPLIAAGPRTKLDANRTYYVRTDGSDSNSGLADTAGGAFLTLQKAWNTIHQTLDLGGFSVTVQIADGTYTTPLVCVGALVGQAATSTVTFRGNSGTPGNVIISTTSSSAITVASGARVFIRDLEIRTTTSGSCVLSQAGGLAAISNVRFGACASRHIESRTLGTSLVVGSYAIVGNAVRHMFATMNGVIEIDTTITVTLTGTPAFSGQFARASINGAIYVNSARVTYSGAATGQRYFATGSGAIDTDGGGANYLPGNAAGSNDSGAGYYG